MPCWVNQCEQWCRPVAFECTISDKLFGISQPDSKITNLGGTGLRTGFTNNTGDNIKVGNFLYQEAHGHTEETSISKESIRDLRNKRGLSKSFWPLQVSLCPPISYQSSPEHPSAMNQSQDRNEIEQRNTDDTTPRCKIYERLRSKRNIYQ